MTKRALLVGINKMRIPGAALRGCVNDVQSLRALLHERLGFPSKQIRVYHRLQRNNERHQERRF